MTDIEIPADRWEEQERYLRSVDADTLLSMPLLETQFLVPGLLPQGTHLLCGSPKVGKSWFALWLALRLAKGEPVFGRQTEPCGVLYLALEDPMARLRDRLYRLTDTAPERLRLANESDLLGNGLEEQLIRHVGKYSTRLVIIDTLQMVRGRDTGGSVYRADYADIGALKNLAETYDFTLLLVHHLRKMTDGDPFNMVSGSNGLSGAVDSTFILSREDRCGDTATLSVTGRDIVTQSFRLAFRQWDWQLLDQTEGFLEEDEPVPPAVRAVVDFMQTRGTWAGTATQLCEELSHTGTAAFPNTIVKQLGRFSRGFLLDRGIHYESQRSHDGRLIGLARLDPPSPRDGT